jgi:rare lipoprotein A
MTVRCSALAPVVSSNELSGDARSTRLQRFRRLAAPGVDTCAALVVCLACLASGCQRVRDQPPSKEASLSLGLRVEPDGDNIRVTWNREAPILAQAAGGILQIADGSSAPREIRLSRHELQTGSVVYANASGKLHFRLDVLVGESVSAFTVGKTGNEQKKTEPDARRENPVRSPTSAPTSTLGQTGKIADQRPGAPQAGVRQRSHEAGLNTASGETGIASFYHPESNRDELTAAYSKAPVGTRVRVTNVANGRSVVVRITNPGPTVNRARVINVSYRAAEELGFVRAGTARVRVAPE